MKYKMVVSDMDDTLLRDELSISTETRDFIIKLQEPSFLKSKSEYIKEKYSNHFSMTLLKPFFLDFMPLGVNKGTSLKILTDTLNIGSDEIIAIGDSFNDAEMLSYAGESVCVANANGFN